MENPIISALNKYPDFFKVTDHISPTTFKTVKVLHYLAPYDINNSKCWYLDERKTEEEKLNMVKEISDTLDLLKWRVILTKDSTCAHDDHEMFNYPRSNYKAKPTLPKGTILEVNEEWSNFYGSYYTCPTKFGNYDIRKQDAEYFSGYIKKQKYNR